jgi:hypothetical protein
MVGLFSLFGLAQALGQSNRDTPKQGTILLDTTELTIGMSRAAVIARLGQSHKLDKEEGEADSWFVFAKDNEGNQPTYRPLGSVQFQNGKLDSIKKKWGPDDAQKGVDFARSIYGAIASLANRGKTDCRIGLDENQTPRGERRSALIVCGDAYIQVDVIRSLQFGDLSDVTEVLRARVK